MSGREGNIYEEALAVRHLAAELEGEDLELSISSETSFLECADVVVSAIRDTAMLKEAARARAKEVDGRAAMLERREERLRNLLLGAMNTANRRKVITPEATISVCDPAPTAVITDETALPPQLCPARMLPPAPDMRAITARLRTGETVPGAEFRNMPPRLNIRVK